MAALKVPGLMAKMEDVMAATPSERAAYAAQGESSRKCRLMGAPCAVLLLAVLGCTGRTAGESPAVEARARTPEAVPAPLAPEGGAPGRPVEPVQTESTLSPSEIARIEELIRRLGDEDYKVREKAAAELPGFGRKALPLLEAAGRSTDLEVAKVAGSLVLAMIWPLNAEEARRRQKDAAEALGVPVERSVDLGGGVKLELVLIPAGMFEMGSTFGKDGSLLREHPVRRVRIARPFWIGKHELTQEVWERVMGASPSRFKGAKNPVETVSWDDCQAFIKVLNALGKEPAVFRLPTEAEWEYACRAGSKARFSFGDAAEELDNYAWHAGNSSDTPHPVGGKKPNPWGLYDCHGNVAEWCQDRYAAYAKSAEVEDDPTGPEQGTLRLFRGGQCNVGSMPHRSAYRTSSAPDARSGLIGFRVVASLPRTP